MMCNLTRRTLCAAVAIGIGVWLTAGCGASASEVSDPVVITLSAPLGNAILRTYGEEFEDFGYDLVALKDGGALMVGQANNTGPNGRIFPGDARALRLDAEGNVLWEQDYNSDIDGLLYSPIQVSDAGFVILGSLVGSYVRNEDDLHLLKIDEGGDLIWSHTFGGPGDDVGKMVRQTSDGGFIVVGTRADEHPSYRNGIHLYQNDLILIKTDEEGNEVWSRTYGEEMLYLGWGVEQTPDGGYVLTGWEAKTIDDRDVFLLKTDEAGEVEWSRRWDLDPGERDGAFDLILTSDGCILVCGIQSMNVGPRQAVLLKVDMNGNEVWLKRFGGEDVHTGFWDVMEDRDGGYIACGDLSSGNFEVRGSYSSKGLILKTDRNGELLWQQVVSTPEYTSMMFSSAAVLPEGGYLFVGRATPTGSAHSDMLWMKTEPPARHAITPETVDSLAEATRFDVGMHAFAVVFLSESLLGVSDSERAVFWDLGAEEPLVEFTRFQRGRVIGLALDRTLVALFTASRTLEIWTVTPLEKVTDLCTIEDTEWPRAEFSADGRLLAVTNRWNDIEIWNLEERTRMRNCVGHHSNMFALAFSPDGQWLASGGGTSSRDDTGESFIGIWDVLAGDRLAWLSTEDLGDNHDLTFSRDGSQLISAGQRRMLAWDTSTWERTYDSGPSYPGSYGIALSPDGSLLAIATDARRIRLMSVEEMRAVRDIYTGAEVLDVDFSGDGTLLAGSFVDGTVRIWETP